MKVSLQGSTATTQMHTDNMKKEDPPYSEPCRSSYIHHFVPERLLFAETMSRTELCSWSAGDSVSSLKAHPQPFKQRLFLTLQTHKVLYNLTTLGKSPIETEILQYISLSVNIRHAWVASGSSAMAVAAVNSHDSTLLCDFIKLCKRHTNNIHLDHRQKENKPKSTASSQYLWLMRCGEGTIQSEAVEVGVMNKPLSTKTVWYAGDQRSNSVSNPQLIPCFV